MSFVYPQVSALEGKPKVGTTQCVALLQSYAGVPNHRAWRAGTEVLGNKNIRTGTAIATFVKGHYPSKPSGNHAALFLRHGVNGFWVMDQWKDDRPPGINKKPRISSRIRSRGLAQSRNGSWPDASNNADAYQIIE
ncbi:BPSL0067 family protein [Pseudoduganella violacea]|uniref:BPSL0067 family protein n=1 Tax=Pseudoduganella violacea TaxID=1715466 RepID=A0A7W5B789_9BURK|nr:BPSL0067 family protein [Pseudoduganella violacea]MBB3117857.1 hypothetical protein [Pseudoduganella violacea]